jgi:hypothetical protein
MGLHPITLAPLVESWLESNECVANCRQVAELCRRVIDSVILQLEPPPDESTHETRREKGDGKRSISNFR